MQLLTLPGIFASAALLLKQGYLWMLFSVFKAANIEYDKRMRRASWAALLLGLGYLALGVLYLQPIYLHLDAQYHSNIVKFLESTIYFPSIIIMIVITAMAERRGRKDIRLQCPNCHKFLAGCRGLVIATKNCPYCGKTVLVEID